MSAIPNLTDHPHLVKPNVGFFVLIGGRFKRIPLKAHRKRSRKKSPVLEARALRKRTPAQPKAILRRENLHAILQTDDSARRVYLGYARFASRRTALSYPSNEHLLKTIQSRTLQPCASCNSRKGRLSNLERKRNVELLAVVRHAGDRLCAEGLLEATFGDNGYATYPRMRLLASDGSRHVISKKAAPGTVFMVPEFFYTSGAGALSKCHNCGSKPLTPVALSLYVVLLSEGDPRRYGGVNPAVLSIRNRKLFGGDLLADWNSDVIVAGLAELFTGGFLSRKRCTISAIDGHLIRRGFHARPPGELNVTVFAVREK